MENAIPPGAARRRWRLVALCGFAVVAVLAAPTARAAEPMAPVVAGYERLKGEAKTEPAARGEVLLGELNCLACHAAAGQKRVMAKGAPDLSKAGARITPQFLRAYLSDPHGVKPGTTMPDVFHASAAEAKAGAVEFLTHYLVSLGGPIQAASPEGTKALVDQGRALYHAIGCVACHAPEKPGAAAVPERGGADVNVPSVPLGNLALKTTTDALAGFLLDPLQTRPHGWMPSSGLSKGEAYAIATYLLREQMENPQNKDQAPVRTPGVKYAYYERNVNTADVTKIDPLRPRSEGRVDKFALTIPNKRANNYAVKFTGTLAVPRDGQYRFWTKSDDGSRLYLDGQLVVDNEGVHPVAEKNGSMDLKAGDHAVTVTFFQGGNEAELTVYWAGPGLARQEIPADVLSVVGGTAMVPLQSESFAVDPEKARMGKQMFAALGCVNCHGMADIPQGRPAKALAALNAEADDGCLGDHVRRGLPQYHLAADQREAIKAALKDPARLNTPLAAGEEVVREMAAMNCYACHRRDGVGGVPADRAEFFVMRAEFDMGDEGRIPPQLTGVGSKLRAEAIDGIVFESKFHIRPALATRMPRFPRDRLAGFVAAVAQADLTLPAADPPFGEQAAKDGRQLFGTKGLGCVNCHGVVGVKSLGMPAPDLTNARERLRFPWFNKLLHDPNAVLPGTRMPAFWADGNVALKDVAGGTVDGQIGALWSYLSLGPSMALPAGLAPLANSELVPIDEPIVHRTFMAEVGPRAILVGYPEHVSVAFDANLVRLAEVWRGRFFDTKGMWQDRGGNALGPLGTDVLKMPPGPAFAVLADPAAPWPAARPDPAQANIARNLGGRFRGFELDKDRRPVFRYELAGVIIEEAPVPLVQPGTSSLGRRFHLTGDNPPAGFTLLATEGAKIEPLAGGTWLVDGKVRVRLTGPAAATLREANGRHQLLVPVQWKNGVADFGVEVSW